MRSSTDINILRDNADEYFEYHPASALWSSLSEARRDILLRMAETDLCCVLGCEEIGEEEPLFQALCEQALFRNSRSAPENRTVLAETISEVGSVSYAQEDDLERNLCPRARFLLRPYQNAGRIGRG